MKYSYILGALCSLAVSPAFAKTTVTSTNLTGPYAGVFGGYNWTDTDGGGNPDGWDGGAFAGYKFDGFLGNFGKNVIGGNIALEGFYGISNSDEGGIQKNDEWGVSMRPGLSFLNGITSSVGINPYGIVGYRNTEFESAGSSDRYDGFELGIGTELVAMGNAGIRLEYSHVWYESNAGISPDSNDVRIGLAWHF